MTVTILAMAGRRRPTLALQTKLDAVPELHVPDSNFARSAKSGGVKSISKKRKEQEEW